MNLSRLRSLGIVLGVLGLFAPGPGCGGSDSGGDLSPGPTTGGSAGAGGSGGGAAGASGKGGSAGSAGSSAGKGGAAGAGAGGSSAGGTAGNGASGAGGTAGKGGTSGSGGSGGSGAAAGGGAGQGGAAGAGGGGTGGKAGGGASGTGGKAGAAGVAGAGNGGASGSGGGGASGGTGGVAGSGGTAGAGGQCDGCGTMTCGYDVSGNACGRCANDGGCFMGKCIKADTCPGTPCIDATGTAICEGGRGLVAGGLGVQTCTCSGGGPSAWISCTDVCGGGSGPESPIARIFHPGDGETRLPNQPIPFIGVAGDPQDGKLTGASLVWMSSLIAVPIGTGESFSAALPVGIHVITLTAKDSQGNLGTDAITLKIDDQSPSAFINHPGNNEVRPANVPILFTGTATDPQDGALTGAAMVWTSDLLGPIGTGLSFMAPLTTGTHVITLTATDKDSNTGTNSLKLFIQ